ncbi:hypothetical protein SASPL_141167 [Salvia splendens]|uniref:Uncharacterized protein n=1 Tax=Salvia splendens TaxID=180675 RepID=A0A8X8ZCB0_SALSN|nr:hypothetical protein SASPL_141167 [Salvia splendens]
MSPKSKEENKVALDLAAWLCNIVTSVGIIIVNKSLMASYGFTFVSDLVKFVLFANFSIVGMNVSLMWNSVGFYQIAKLSMIPVSCLLEVKLDRVRYSRDTKLSIVVVLLGVAIRTVNDVSVNAKGFVAAVIAPLEHFSAAVFCSSSSTEALHRFVQLVRPHGTTPGCIVAAGRPLHGLLADEQEDVCWNILCHRNRNQSNPVHLHRKIHGRFIPSASHLKTILVLTLGFLFFGREGLNLHVVVGMVIAVVGMVWYGHASSQPGGKERVSSSNKLDEEAVALVKSNEPEGNV